MKKWYLAKGREKEGPFDLDEIKRRISLSGSPDQIGPDTYVWASGIPEWTKASKVKELAPLFESDSPILLETEEPTPLLEKNDSQNTAPEGMAPPTIERTMTHLQVLRTDGLTKSVKVERPEKTKLTGKISQPQESPPKKSKALPPLSSTMVIGFMALLVSVYQLVFKTSPQTIYGSSLTTLALPTGLPKERLKQLETLSKIPLKAGARLEIDVPKVGYRGPLKLFLSSNLPDQLALLVWVKPVAARALTTKDDLLAFRTPLIHSFAEVGPLQFLDHSPLAEGYYQVLITEDTVQPPPVTEWLNGLPKAVGLPSSIPATNKLFFEQSVLLKSGGEKEFESKLAYFKKRITLTVPPPPAPPPRKESAVFN